MQRVRVFKELTSFCRGEARWLALTLCLAPDVAPNFTRRDSCVGRDLVAFFSLDPSEYAGMSGRRCEYLVFFFRRSDDSGMYNSQTVKLVALNFICTFETHEDREDKFVRTLFVYSRSIPPCFFNFKTRIEHLEYIREINPRRCRC